MRGEGSVGASTGAPKDQKWPKLTKILNCFLNKTEYTNWHSCGCWAGAVMLRARAMEVPDTQQQIIYHLRLALSK